MSGVGLLQEARPVDDVCRASSFPADSDSTGEM